MGEEDHLEDTVKGDYYPPFTGQVRGTYYFTNERIIFFSGIIGTSSFSIRYADVTDIKKSFVGPFMPFRINVTAKDIEKGKEKKYK